MKKTEKGRLILQKNSKDKLEVLFHPVNQTIWMDKNELCELFDSYMPTIDKCLEDIFKTKTFCIEDVCKYHRVIKGGKITYDIWAVNLKVIIAMSFRLESTNAKNLREWFVEQLLKQEQSIISISTTDCSFSLN